MRRNARVDVVIPVSRPDARLRALLDALSRQSMRPAHILIINAEEKYWKEEYVKDHPEAEIYHIGKKEYIHGNVHNMGAGLVSADAAVFLTQDVLPSDDRMISKLLRPMRSEDVKVVYGRQIPERRSGIMDGYEMMMRFPDESGIRTEEDLAAAGRNACYNSNICAAYDMEAFRALDGFPENCIAAEDQLYAAKVLAAGWSVAYCAGAAVYRNVRLSNADCFRKSFDEGVAYAQHPGIVGTIRDIRDEEGSERIRQLLEEAGLSSYRLRFEWRQRVRRIGFRLGTNYRKLPARLAEECSSNRRFWSQNRHKAEVN
ncbi:MAG: glycosyltransferase [Lachnospiraceae bacterium]|nr:glycosyltransferase [Lachnospiraceae bacterium]